MNKFQRKAEAEAAAAAAATAASNGEDASVVDGAVDQPDTIDDDDAEEAPIADDWVVVSAEDVKDAE